MIELKLTGHCEGCTHADIMTSCDYADELIIHTSIVCSHAEVCDMWQDRMKQALRSAQIKLQQEETT